LSNGWEPTPFSTERLRLWRKHRMSISPAASQYRGTYIVTRDATVSASDAGEFAAPEVSETQAKPLYPQSGSMVES
jgi:hypothetical protein